MDTREITRIVVINTARIDLPIWLRSEPYVTATEVNSAFYPPWYGKISISFWAES